MERRQAKISYSSMPAILLVRRQRAGTPPLPPLDTIAYSALG